MMDGGSFVDLATAGLVAVGAIALLLALLGMRRIQLLLNGRGQRRAWRTLALLSSFFLIGYALTVILVLTDNFAGFLSVLSGVIFLSGGVFVFLVVRTGRLTIDDLLHTAAECQRAEADLRDYQDQLERLVDRRTDSLAAANERLRLEVAERRRAEEALRCRLSLEELAARISTRFIGLMPGDVDDGINEALSTIGRSLGADHGAVCLFSEGRAGTTRTHQWTADGQSPLGCDLASRSVEKLPWVLDHLYRLEGVWLSAAEGMPIESRTDVAYLEGQGIRSFTAVPLVSAETAIGFLGFASAEAKRDWNHESATLLRIVGQVFVAALERKTHEQELAYLACHDQLTGLANHRHLMDRLDEELARALRSGHPMSVVMMDIDDFKLFNDTYGHPLGDDILRLVAKILRETLRSTDLVGRYGGDEFLALLPETDQEEASRVAGRITAAIRAQRISVPSTLVQKNADDAGEGGETSISIPLRVSAGLAVYPYDSASRLELICLADSAMYASKRAGGDTATLAQSTDSAFLASQNGTFSVLEGLVTAVNNKDHYTRAHSEQVAWGGLGIAESMGLGEEAKRTLRIAGLLHDVGKIGVPDRILKKPGKLDDDERNMIQQHPLLGELMIREVPQLVEVLDVVRFHHERYDGTGYPRELKGEEIPFLARIIAVADAYSAMTLDRPYRRALTKSQAIEELRRGAGSQFDPQIVEVFVQRLISHDDQLQSRWPESGPLAPAV